MYQNAIFIEHQMEMLLWTTHLVIKEQTIRLVKYHFIILIKLAMRMCMSKMTKLS